MKEPPPWIYFILFQWFFNYSPLLSERIFDIIGREGILSKKCPRRD
jgi:hypothetical protein